jgi:hypothetical protein
MLDIAYVDDLQIHWTPQYMLTAGGVTGLGGSPSPRMETSDRAQRHGLINQTQFYGGRTIGLKGIASGSSAANALDLVDTLKGKLALGGSHVFRFTREGHSYSERCLVTVAAEVQADQDVPGKVVPWSCVLLAADPRIYTDDQRSGTYDPTASSTGGGAPLPVVFPIVFTTSTVTELVLVNSGNFKTPPLFTIKGPIINPILDNDTTSEHITLQANLGSQDTVVVDVAARSVLLNGASRPDLLTASATTWWDMIPGQNALRLRGTGMTPGVTLLTVQYRDARI